MGKITLNQIKQDFEEIVGWGYISPGTNDENGIDCSGAWVRCYKKHGFNILHGSNSIYRKECSATGQITSNDDLEVGMMVFKNRSDGKEPVKYLGDGLGNFYHIGAITSKNPLVVTHATSPNAKQDKKFNSNRNGWTHWGIGNKVDMSAVYEEDSNQNIGGEEDMATVGELQDKTCIVVTDDKKSVNLREQGNIKGDLVARVPYGNTVLVTSDNGKEYVGVRWEDINGVYKPVGKAYTGFMSRNYLSIYNYEEEDDSEDSSNVDVIVIDEKSDLEKRIYNATVATGATVEYAETLKKCAFELFPEFADK